MLHSNVFLVTADLSEVNLFAPPPPHPESRTYNRLIQARFVLQAMDIVLALKLLTPNRCYFIWCFNL